MATQDGRLAAIAGVARPGQATSNAGAVGWEFTPEEFDEVSALGAL